MPALGSDLEIDEDGLAAEDPCDAEPAAQRDACVLHRLDLGFAARDASGQVGHRGDVAAFHAMEREVVATRRNVEIVHGSAPEIASTIGAASSHLAKKSTCIESGFSPAWRGHGDYDRPNGRNAVSPHRRIQGDSHPRRAT